MFSSKYASTRYDDYHNARARTLVSIIVNEFRKVAYLKDNGWEEEGDECLGLKVSQQKDSQGTDSLPKYRILSRNSNTRRQHVEEFLVRVVLLQTWHVSVRSHNVKRTDWEEGSVCPWRAKRVMHLCRRGVCQEVHCLWDEVIKTASKPSPLIDVSRFFCRSLGNLLLVISITCCETFLCLWVKSLSLSDLKLV